MPENERELHPSNKQQEIKRYTYHYISCRFTVKIVPLITIIAILLVIYGTKVHLN